MARGRMLNRGVAISEKVARLEEEAGAWALVFHHRLIAFLDVNGCCRADPYWLKAEVMPRVAGCSPEDCRMFAAALDRVGLAVMYEERGMPYLHFPGFREEQVGLRADREKPEVPVPQGFDHDAGRMPENFRRVAGKNPAEVEVEGEVEAEGDANASLSVRAPIAEMHELFVGILGGEPPHPSLTPARREKYRALWDEHLSKHPDWPTIWRSLLAAITDSDHHMSERGYQMPESFLRNQERRDTWILKAAERMSGEGRLTKADRALLRHRQQLEEINYGEAA